MRDSNRDRNFKRRDFGGRPAMHQAVCDECGQQCEVPFRPTGDKPIYCNTCFDKRKQSFSGDRPRRDRDFDRPRRDRDFDRSRNKPMFTAVCDKCGQNCEVPFQPSAGKPVYCDACFGKAPKSDNRGGGSNDQIQAISAKLDKIINALIEAKIMKPAKVEKPVAVKEAKKEPAAKAATKKEAPAKKEAPKKKEVAKKATKKKK